MSSDAELAKFLLKGCPGFGYEVDSPECDELVAEMQQPGTSEAFPVASQPSEGGGFSPLLLVAIAAAVGVFAFILKASNPNHERRDTRS